MTKPPSSTTRSTTTPPPPARGSTSTGPPPPPSAATTSTANITGIYADGYQVAEPILVTGNTVYDNSGTGIDARYNVHVVGNTVYGHDAANAIGIYGHAHAVVRQNVVYANDYGIYAYYGQPTENRVYDNQIGIWLQYDSDARGNQVYANSVGINAASGSGQIENNLVYANTNYGIVLHGAGTAVTNNTVYQQVGDAVRVESSSVDVRLRNNILWVESGYAIAVSEDSLQGFDSDYNLVHQGADPNAHYGLVGDTTHDSLLEWQAATGGGAYSLEGMPRFVDPNGADNVFGFDASGEGLDGGSDDNFQLAAGSPAIDRADSWAAAVIDLSGMIRVDDPGTPNQGSDDYFEDDLTVSSFGATGTARNFHTENSYFWLDFATLRDPAFSFNFYGQDYTSVYVSVNGFLQFGGTAEIYDPSNSVEKLTHVARIAPLWDDLSTWAAKDVYVDDSLAGQLTIRWDATNQADGSDVNAAVTLLESGRIEFHYGSGNTNLSPTIGISRGDGQHYVLASTSGSSTLTDAASIAFVLQPGLADLGAYEFAGSSLDTTPPTILGTHPAEIDGGQFLPSWPGSLTISFNEAINVIDAVASSNYELRWAGSDERLGTGDDALIDLLPSYVAGTTTVAIDVVGPLPAGIFQLTVKSNVGTNSGVHDLAGLLLDGDGDSVEGGDYVRTFAARLTPASFDGDGDVDGQDFLIWQLNFGTMSGATFSQGDADLDGDVDGQDFLIWQLNFGSGSAGQAATAAWQLGGHDAHDRAVDAVLSQFSARSPQFGLREGRAHAFRGAIAMVDPVVDGVARRLIRGTTALDPHPLHSPLERVIQTELDLALESLFPKDLDRTS